VDSYLIPHLYGKKFTFSVKRAIMKNNLLIKKILKKKLPHPNKIDLPSQNS
jgi:hypothetical protein